jgi:CBS domain-containing protein
MSQSLTHRLSKPVTPLVETDSVASAATRLLEGPLRSLPVVDPRKHFVGVFGEREFLRAMFPRYMGELRSAAFVTHALDESIEHRASSSGEPIKEFMTKDHVDVPDTASDLQLAETFLHHRVLILPVVRDRAVTGIIDRQEFFAELARTFLGRVPQG